MNTTDDDFRSRFDSIAVNPAQLAKRFMDVYFPQPGDPVVGNEDCAIPPASDDGINRDVESRRSRLHQEVDRHEIAHSVLHTTEVLRLSTDLPEIIEIVDSQDNVDRLLPILDDMVQEGLVTIEKVRVLKYGAKSQPSPS